MLARLTGDQEAPGVALRALAARLRAQPVDLHVLTTRDGRRAVSAWPLEEVEGELRARAGRDVVPVVLEGREVIEVPGDGR